VDLENELAEVLREESSKHGVPGVVAGIVIDDERVVAASGVTSIDDPQPVDGATLFQVGSITKTFTSAAIMLLARDGLLSLDDPAAKHVPELRAQTGLDLDAITVEHLLSHQGRIRRATICSSNAPASSVPYEPRVVSSHPEPASRTTTPHSRSRAPSSNELPVSRSIASCARGC
jgi:CubicO group peptidase (beta-lactamase class C family)